MKVLGNVVLGRVGRAESAFRLFTYLDICCRVEFRTKRLARYLGCKYTLNAIRQNSKF
jgi:hypothetical protein